MKRKVKKPAVALSANGLLNRAVRIAVTVGLGGVATTPMGAAAQTTTDQPTELERVEVTGSRIKRVELETSNPVLTLDRSAIEASGVTTLGELLQAIPTVTGVLTNTQVNNGGGTGAADVNLRGLESKRTLVLIDGERFVNPFSANINTLPTNMIERIEVLKEGASAIYGSDAIGGVVNIITRKSFTGAELVGHYGETFHNDGRESGASLIWGTAGGDSKLVLGLDYVSQDPILSPDRNVTDRPYAFYYGVLSENGFTSSRSPFGRYGVSAAVQAAAGSPCAGGASTVTRIAGTDGSQGSEYRCFINSFAPGPTDRYNFQPDNLAKTPYEHHSIFGLWNHALEPSLSLFGSVFYTNTKANYQLAPEPFDNGTVQALSGAAIPVSQYSVYNPFGDAYLGAVGQDITSYALRANLAGTRISIFDTNTYQATGGFKGVFADRFNFDVSGTFGRILQTTDTTGFLNFSNLAAQMGPSYDALDGNPLVDGNGDGDPVDQPTCGSDGTDGLVAVYTIPGCTPLNIFGTNGNNIGILNTTTHQRFEFTHEIYTANITGDVATLPWGAVGLAVGSQYRKLRYNFQPDELGREFNLSEANSLPTNGEYDVNELYGEASVPVFGGVPGVHALNLSLGLRYSSYSSFGETTNAKYGLEYRPIQDLMFRATYADVFRAPTTTELFLGAAQSAPLYTDPCNGETTPVGADPNIDAACENVPRDGTYAQNNSQATVNLVGTPTLDPEEGHALDYGIVYSPDWFDPLTVELDVWEYELDKAIQFLSIQTSVDTCYNFGVFCENIDRANDGQLALGTVPFANVGKFETSGVDIGFRLNFPNSPIGKIVVGWDNTYLKEFRLTQESQGIKLDELTIAGQFDGNVFGASFPRYRAIAFINWEQGPFSASIYDKYIGEFNEGRPDAGIDLGDDGQSCLSGAETTTNIFGQPIRCYRRVSAANYVNLQGTYALAPWATDFTLGINDVFNDGAELVTLGFNGSTDTGAYNIEGRSYFARVTKSFK